MQFILCGVSVSRGLLHVVIYSRILERRADLDFALMCFSMAAAALFERLSYQAVTIDGSEIIYVDSSKPNKLTSFWQILRIPINQRLLKSNGDVMMYAA